MAAYAELDSARVTIYVFGVPSKRFSMKRRRSAGGPALPMTDGIFNYLKKIALSASGALLFLALLQRLLLWAPPCTGKSVLSCPANVKFTFLPTLLNKTENRNCGRKQERRSCPLSHSEVQGDTRTSFPQRGRGGHAPKSPTFVRRAAGKQ